MYTGLNCCNTVFTQTHTLYRLTPFHEILVLKYYRETLKLFRRKTFEIFSNIYAFKNITVEMCKILIIWVFWTYVVFWKCIPNYSGAVPCSATKKVFNLLRGIHNYVLYIIIPLRIVCRQWRNHLQISLQRYTACFASTQQGYVSIVELFWDTGSILK